MHVHRTIRPLLIAALLLPGTAALAAMPPPTPPTPDDTWDSLAQCESSGDWQADTGNGFYGGLQIWPPTWQEAGGLDLADRPDHATRRQQITIAEEILRQQGWRAWSGCARRLGLLEPTDPASAPPQR